VKKSVIAKLNEIQVKGFADCQPVAKFWIFLHNLGRTCNTLRVTESLCDKDMLRNKANCALKSWHLGKSGVPISRQFLTV